MRRTAAKLLSALALLVTMQAYSQITPHTTADYRLFGYPQQVRYMKFESDSNLKNQRTSFIEDYQLTFDNQRRLTERTNYIDGRQDRHCKFEYDNNRHLAKETLMEADNKIVSLTEYTYNYLGRVSQITTVEYPQSCRPAHKRIGGEAQRASASASPMIEANALLSAQAHARATTFADLRRPRSA